MTPGDQIRDWTIDALLGQGAMGQVYRVRNRHHPGIVRALKVIRPDLAADPAADRLLRAAFLEEAAVLDRLRHPNVCWIESPFEEAGRLCLVMELLDGKTFQDWLAGGPVRAEVLVPLLRQACSGVAHAHVQGVVHRDLKPSNLFVCTQGIPEAGDAVKVLDFGLARLAAAAPQDAYGPAEGTPLYLAPEVLAGGPASPAADVYALGLVLYLGLAGRLPFDLPPGSTPTAIRRAVDQAHRAGLPGLGTFVSGLPPTLESLVLGCLDPRPPFRPGG